MGDGAHDALRPRLMCGLEQHLKQSKFALLQLGKCADDADEGIKFAAGQRQHEFLRQSKFNRQCFITCGCVPCLLQRSLARSKHGFGKIRLQLSAQQWCIF